MQTQTCAKVLPANGGRPSGGAGEATVGLVSGGHGDIAGLGARSPRGILRLILSLSLFFLFFLLFLFFAVRLWWQGRKRAVGFLSKVAGGETPSFKNAPLGLGKGGKEKRGDGGGEEEEK